MKIFSFFNGWNFKITSSKSKAPLEKKIEGVPSKKTADAAVFRRDESYRDPIPKNQQQLLLHAPKELHTFIGTAAIPELEASHDILIRIQVIGLNPIDWKASAYNFGLPQLPCVSGRDFVGVVIKSSNSSSRIKPGDLVLTASTDYRDSRKAAFQQFAIASDFNVARIPRELKLEASAALGVAFVTAALALGICLGIDFGDVLDGMPTGPNLLRVTKSLQEEEVPQDVREECLGGIDLDERPMRGDWIAIWGASSSVAFLSLQLAKLLGFRVICVADAIKHGSLLVEAGADVLVHRHNTADAISIIRGVTNNRLRFGLDAIGKETAGFLQNAMNGDGRRAHLVGLTGVPKDKVPGVAHHKVPVKMFHSNRIIGDSLMAWLEELLVRGKLKLPKTEIASGGLRGVNDALQTLRDARTPAQRIVVPI